MHPEPIKRVMENLFIETETFWGKLVTDFVYLPHGEVYSFECAASYILIKYSSVIVRGNFNFNLFSPGNPL